MCLKNNLVGMLIEASEARERYRELLQTYWDDYIDRRWKRKDAQVLRLQDKIQKIINEHKAVKEFVDKDLGNLWIDKL